MPGKPVGLTYIAIVTEADEVIKRYVWQGDRIQNKAQASGTALQLLIDYLQGAVK